MKVYYWETWKSQGEFNSDSDENAIKWAKSNIDELLVLYTQNTQGDFIVLCENVY